MDGTPTAREISAAANLRRPMKKEIHYGDIPLGARMACGMNRYRSTKVTDIPVKVTCSDCTAEIERAGAYAVRLELRQFAGMVKG